ncbi:cellulose synthase subunit BcsC-related outer membrane protein [Klebsiella pneumoniae]|nr:cellulose synthase subunit BcsC-related outer membrane protein [Klebsiella pneumoniae]
MERRVTSNWFVGAAVDIQQAKDYTPSHALLYVRYSAARLAGGSGYAAPAAGALRRLVAE